MSVGRLRVMYIAALLGIGAMAVWKFTSTNVLLTRLESSGSEIDTAGRQRMLCQQIAKAALKFEHAASHSAAVESHDELSESLDLFVRSHQALRYGTEIDGLPLNPPPPAVREAFDRLEPHFARFTGAAYTLLEWEVSHGFADSDAPEVRNAIDTVLAADSVYVEKMDAIVAMYASELDRVVHRLMTSKMLLLFVTFGILLLEAGLVFEPAVRRLRRQMVHLETARADAERLSQAKSGFLANMSHELRTPMTAITGYAELLLDPEQTPADRSSHVAMIRRAAGHLTSVIDDVLDMSSIESGRLAIHPAPVDPAELVRDVVGVMTVVAEGRGLGLEASASGPLPRRFRADPVRVRQILVNLISNGVKFTESGGVRVRAGVDDRSGEGWVWFEVEDSGIGISADALERVFEPFVQCEASTTRRFGGSGLGLSISRRLAEQMGGSLTARSSLGSGSVFRLELPAGPAAALELAEADLSRETARRADAEQQRETENVPGPACTPGPLKGLRVLIADDSSDNRRLLSHHLRRGGAEVEAVENGRQAVDRVTDTDRGAFDLLLIDMHMPEMDGPEAIRELRRLGCRLPMLVVTANVMAEDRAVCERAGCDAVLTKPISAAELVGACLRWVGADGGAARAA
ncbi:MAG: ATP-binding protein [Planctomycetota bacterium]